MENTRLLEVMNSQGREIERVRDRQEFRDIGQFYAPFENLPGLRGLWTPGSVDNGGSMFDRSGQGRTLTYNGNPQLDIHNDLVPFWDHDGVGDYFSRIDEAGLDVTGAEGAVAAARRGLTVGGWFKVDALATRYGLLNKYLSAGNQRAWALWVFETGTAATFYTSGDGLNVTGIISATTPLVAGEWTFIAGRYMTNLSSAVFVNEQSWTDAAVSATLFNSTAAFEIGRFDGGSALAGGCAVAFMCGCALSDTLLKHLYNAGRTVLGV